MGGNRGRLAILGLVVAAIAAGLTLGGWLRQAGVPNPPGGAPELVRSVGKDYQRAVYDPIHFKPAIDTARDDQCLACHGEVLGDRVRPVSPAGVRASSSRAWYQALTTYTGEQETFHRRHLVTPLARELMALSCNTCHQGHDPRDEAPGSSASGYARSDQSFTLRKQVNPETTCLKCHGQMPVQLMGLPGPWPEHKAAFGSSCLTCHGTVRTSRHQVNYLRPEAIEAAGQRNSDVCYGCHGGRAWYRIAYPYPRHPWTGMDTDLPAWAKTRPVESEARFRMQK